MKKILFALLLFLSLTKISAYENKYFKMDVPDYFKIFELDNNTYKWISTKNSHEYIIVSVSKNNSSDKKDINDYNDTDLKNYEKYIEDEINKELEDYKFKVTVSNVKKEIKNNLDTITYDVFWPTQDSILYNTYQKGYSFATNNYIYIYTYTSDKEITTDNKDYLNTINSFIPNDSSIEKDGFLNGKWKHVLIASIVLGVLGYIISKIVKRK